MDKILFQYNVALMREPFDHPIWDDFKSRLEELHLLADDNPSFLWRYQGEKDEHGYIHPYRDNELLMGNLSAWSDYSSLFDYTFTAGHLDIMKSKRKWFIPLPQPWSVLFYGEPSDLERSSEDLLEEAKQRLVYLADNGESPFAFGFGNHKGVFE